MKRIMIIGSGGAGKSTLSLQISKITKIPVVHLDSYYWKPNWEKTPSDKWEAIVQNLINENNWIIDGNYGGTMELRFNKADTIIFLDFPRIKCLFRATKRRYSKKRVDEIKDCKEMMDWEFIKWIWNYPKNRTPIILNMLKELKDKNVIIMKNDKQKDRFLEQLEMEF